MDIARAPWASGPGEILQHGLTLLKKENDTSRRLAMLSIDNAVELMIKTYLGLPKRVTGLTLTRSRYEEISESFPKLLDALQEFASDRLPGIDLGEIEWYHRLRNQLYHQGNGLTVEREKVRVYAELAKILFRNLFGQDIAEEPSETAEERLIGQFLRVWNELEEALLDAWAHLERGLTQEERMRMLMTPQELADKGWIDDELAKEISELRALRHKVVHAQNIGAGKTFLVGSDLVKRMKTIVHDLKKTTSEHTRGEAKD